MDVEVGDAVAVHRVVAVVVGRDVGFALVGIGVQPVDTGSVGSNEYRVLSEFLYAVDGDVCQFGL